MPEMVTAMAKRQDGTLLVASENGLNIFDPATGVFHVAKALEPHLPGNRTNDGAPDAKGRFWIGTMQNNLAADGIGSADHGGRSDPCGVSSPDLSAVAGMDRPQHHQRRRLEPGFRQALCGQFDAEPNLRLRLRSRHAARSDPAAFSATFPISAIRMATPSMKKATCGAPGGKDPCVARITPDGESTMWCRSRRRCVTSCAFGGENLDTLFVTTSGLSVDAQTLARYPQQGGLFAFKPGVRGLPRPIFGG